MRILAIALLALLTSGAVIGCSGGGGDADRPREQPPENPPPDDPDPPAELPVLSVDDVTAEEASGSLTFIVRLAGARGDDSVSVSYATVDGSASAGTDYTSRSGSLTFAAAETEQTVVVDLLDDAEGEPTETFTLELSEPNNAELGDAAGTATIIDDDRSPVCGEPGVGSTRNTQALLWKDCEAGVWRFRAGAPEGDVLTYTGGVTAADAFLEVTAVGLESNDDLDTTDARRIDFSLRVFPGNQDGFDFAVASDAGTCFEIVQPGATVVVGASSTTVTTPVDLATLEACTPTEPELDGPLNVVVVFADDQRFDTLQHMPNVSNRLLPAGVEFENAYVPTPLCCPARASTYSGGFLAQNTGVLENGGPNGARRQFNDQVNIGTELQAAGYRTLFAGKWLNDYPLQVPYVPPGWDAFAGRAVWATGSPWNQFEYLIGSSGASSSTGSRVDASGQYHVYFERDQILSFIEAGPADQPFMVFWATTPPHPPAEPAPGDETAFADFSFRGRGYGETDFSDKPEWLQRFSAVPDFSGDAAVRAQLRSMLSVDDAIGWIVDALAARDELEETVFILTSDNGYMWGEHGLWGKNFAYEESIRVPLLVVVPGIEPRRESKLVSAVLDLGPTLYDIAGVTGDSDGRSLMPLLRDPDIDWRNELLFEKYENGTWQNALWAGLRQGDWKYVQYWTGDDELYDLGNDPYELESLAEDPAHAARRFAMAARLESLLGLAIKPGFDVPGAAVAEPYEYDFEPWGGEPPYVWQVESGALPAGLTLNSSTGTIAGTPRSVGTSTFSLRVTSSDFATQAGRRKTFVSRELTLDVVPE